MAPLKFLNLKCTTSAYSTQLSALLSHKIHSEKKQIYVCGPVHDRIQYTGSLMHCTGGNHTCLKRTLRLCRTDSLHSHRLSSSDSPPSTQQHPHTNTSRRWQRSGYLKTRSWCKAFQLAQRDYLNSCRLSCSSCVYVCFLTIACWKKKESNSSK